MQQHRCFLYTVPHEAIDTQWIVGTFAADAFHCLFSDARCQLICVWNVVSSAFYSALKSRLLVLVYLYDLFFLYWENLWSVEQCNIALDQAAQSLWGSKKLDI